MPRYLVTIFPLFVLSLSFALSVSAQQQIFKGVKFEEADAVLVSQHSEQDSKILYAWQANQTLVPASLTKLVTAWLALEKWGAEHRFTTDFYIHQRGLETTLWIRGYGDPFLTSEELDRVAERLAPLLNKVDRIAVDNSWFDIAKVPGRTRVVDPYNAPLSAVSANFNTVFLERREGQLMSAEPQTPLTATAVRVGRGLRKDKERVNLVNSDNAQHYFAEVLAQKMGLPTPTIVVNSKVPLIAEKILSYKNSNTLSDNLRASLKYSNNFISNQIFLKLAEPQSFEIAHDERDTSSSQKLSFDDARRVAELKLKQHYSWHDFSIAEGAGLSRDNRFNAKQIDDVLVSLMAQKSLLKHIDVGDDMVEVYAKTGTLEGVRSYAGYIQVKDKDVVANYTFVFIFNRNVPFKYRDAMLSKLLKDLQ